MPRASDGTVTLPVGNPVVTGTAISADVQNNTIADLASMIEDSLSRTGKGGMQVPLEFAGGSSATPGVTFSGDTDTGVYSDTVNEVAIAAGGQESATFTATGVAVPGTLGVTGAATLSSTLAVTGVITATAGVTGITSAQLPAANYVLSAFSSGSFNTPNMAWTDVTNLTISITTHGRPVLITLVPDGSAFTCGFWTKNTSAVALGGADVKVVRDVTDVSLTGTVAPAQVGALDGLGYIQYSGPLAFDAPVAGTYVYKVQVKNVTATSTTYASFLKLLAYEL